ncbi:MAG: AAA family ATPase, partial [Actinomycetota bacterium]
MASLLCPELIGRRHELDELRALLDRTRLGSGGFALVSGEAGVGKSRFVSMALADLDRHGTRVAVGGCLSELRLLPYAPVVDALRALAAGIDPAGARPFDPYLLYLLPDLEPDAPAPISEETLDSGAIRHRLGQAVCGLLETRARTAPVVLVLEDLQWSDAATKELVPLLARRFDDQPVAVIATCRSEATEDPEAFRALADLARRHGHPHIELGPLDTDEVAEMISSIFGVGGPVTGEFARAVHERTGGNPLFVEELLTTLVDAGVIFRRNGTWDRRALDGLEVPSTIKETILRRVRPLPDDLLEMLRIASVMGERFELDVLVRLMGLGHEDAIEAIRELVAKQLVVEDAPTGFRFRHALTRDTINSELLSVERRAIHRRIAETLETIYSDNVEAHAAELAHHYDAAGDADNAGRCALLAADHAERLGALRDARSHLAMGLRLSIEETERASLLRRSGNLGLYIGLLKPAISELGDAAAIYGQLGDVMTQAATLLELAIVLLMNGDNARSLALRHHALEILEPLGDSVELAWAYRALGHHNMLSSAYERSLSWSEKAITLGKRLGADELVGEASLDLASSYFYARDPEEGLALLRHSVKTGVQDNRPKQAARAYQNLSSALLMRGYYREAIEVSRAGIEYSTSRGIEFSARMCISILAPALRLLGRWDEADDDLR